MSKLSEEKVLLSVEVITQHKVAQVKWENRILRDGVVINATPHRSSYGETQKEAFLAEVEGAKKFIAALGWE